MDKKETNRAKQIPIEKEFIKGIKLRYRYYYCGIHVLSYYS